MVALTEVDKDRAYFHLGIGSRAGVPAGDLARVEEACNTIPSDYMHGKIIEQLDLCDLAHESQKLNTPGFRYGTREVYSGDINRAIVRESAKDVRHWRENYRDEVRELAQLLWVPNWREDGADRYRYSRDGGAFINILPGVADTSTASRRLEWVEFAGSFGF